MFFITVGGTEFEWKEIGMRIMNDVLVVRKCSNILVYNTVCSSWLTKEKAFESTNESSRHEESIALQYLTSHRMQIFWLKIPSVSSWFWSLLWFTCMHRFGIQISVLRIQTLARLQSELAKIDSDLIVVDEKKERRFLNAFTDWFVICVRFQKADLAEGG